MKYLKTYNESIVKENSCEEVYNTCSDILLDIKDKGYDVNMTLNTWETSNYNPKADINWIDIEIMKEDTFISDMNEIEESVTRISNYLSTMGLVLGHRSKLDRLPGTLNWNYFNITFNKSGKPWDLYK